MYTIYSLVKLFGTNYTCIDYVTFKVMRLFIYTEHLFKNNMLILSLFSKKIINTFFRSLFYYFARNNILNSLN